MRLHRVRLRANRALTYLVAVASCAVLAGCVSDQRAAPRQPQETTPAASGQPAAPTVSAAASASGEAARAFGLPTFAPPPPPQPITVPIGSTAPIYQRLPVHQPVAFLTMDDGQTQLPIASKLMQAAHIPFTMFLIAPVAAKNPPFFRQLEDAGGVIEDHTITHPVMRGLSYERQRHEICTARDSERTTFGITPRFFRPPYGEYDHNTLKAAHDCGLQAVFSWSETVNDGKVYYQTSSAKIEPGDIILMHFRPAFVADVKAALAAIHAAGLTPALLENYLQ